MENRLLNTLLRRLETLHYQLGWLGSAGVLMISMALLSALLLLIPAQQQLQQKSLTLAKLQQQPAQRPVTQTPLLNDEQALQKFYRQFPLVDALSPALAQLHQLAAEQGLVLSAGEYKLSNDAKDPNLLRYEIIFPLQCNYKNLKNFISTANLKFPTLALNEINIKRESIGDSSAQIKLSFVWLLVRSY